MPRTRWGAEAPEDAPAAKGRLVGAAAACFAEPSVFLELLLDEARRKGAIRGDVAVGDAAECFTGVVLSRATMPSGRGPADQRRLLREYFVPAFLPADSSARQTARRRDGD